MAENKIQMPSSMGGLVRYFDDYKSKIEIKATLFIAFVCLVVFVYLYIYFF